jgi:hypothetical protein
VRRKDTHTLSLREGHLPQALSTRTDDRSGAGIGKGSLEETGVCGSLVRGDRCSPSSLVWCREERLSVGQGYQIIRSSVDEECEREIEADHEQEEEAEREEVPKMAPCSETDWDYDGLVAGRVARAAAVPSSKALGAVVGSRRYSIKGPVYRASIPWSRAVYCTANFVETVKECNGAAVATKEDYLHLRLVRSLLVFEGEGGILLLSERERPMVFYLAFIIAEPPQRRKWGCRSIWWIWRTLVWHSRTRRGTRRWGRRLSLTACPPFSRHMSMTSYPCSSLAAILLSPQRSKSLGCIGSSLTKSGTLVGVD